jgi:hypothetical protein
MTTAKKLPVVHIAGIGPRISAKAINELIDRPGDTIDGMALLSIKSACKALNCGRSTLYRLIERQRAAA